MEKEPIFHLNSSYEAYYSPYPLNSVSFQVCGWA